MPPVVIDIRGAEDSRDVVHRAVQALVEGKLVAFPTETVYGLAASATSEEGVNRLLEVKDRGNTPLTLAVKSADDALDYVPAMSRLGRRLARRCWPGPLTLVMEDNHPESLLTQLPPAARQAVCGTGSVGLRVPAHAAILDSMRMMVGPVVLTSANRRQQPESMTAQEVVQSLGDDVHMVLDDGRSRYGQPSSVVRVRGSQFEVLRAGVFSQQALERLATYLLVFVCTGNTCRSPMAEVLARHLIAKRLGCEPAQLADKGVQVLSAGVSALMGGPPANEAVEVMSEMGLDLREHETQPLTEQLVRHADLICTMTASHRQIILSQFPEAAAWTRVLSQDQSDVSDPIGGPPDLYRRCAAQIQAELERLIEGLEFL